MPVWATWILDYLWKKIVPAIVGFVKNLVRKKEIDKEAEEKKAANLTLRDQAMKFIVENPGVKLPKELEDALRDIAARTNQP